MIKRASFVVAVGFVVAMSGCVTGEQPLGGLPNAKATRAQVLRGRYIALTTGCGNCHGQGKDNPADPMWLAGYVAGTPGQPFQIGPFKTYAANLTPDPDTGLGKWSDQDIFNALRTGKDPDGQYLAPPMPWPEIRNMTDEDLWAIVAYLRSIKPVVNEVPESEGPNPYPNGHGNWSDSYANLPPVGLPAYPGANENEVK